MNALRDRLLAFLADVVEAEKAATEGPWEAWQDPGVNTMRVRVGLPSLDHDPEPSPYWSVQIEGSVYPAGAVAACGTEDEHGKQDARLIALSRSVVGPFAEGLADEIQRFHDAPLCGDDCPLILRWAERLGVAR